MLESFSVNSIIQFITTLAALSVVALLWKNKNLAEVRYLILIEISVAIWAFAYAIEFNASQIEEKIFWSQLSYLGIAFLPVNYLFFTLAFNQKHRLVSLKNYLFISILPIVTIFLVFSNKYHHWIWNNVRLDKDLNIMFYQHGAWFWLFYGYAFLLIMLGMMNLLRSYFRFSRYYRGQISILILASIIPIIGNLSYILNINPIPGFDWTTVCFVITGLIIAVGIYRHRMFEIIPLATQKLLEVLQDGVIVINKNGHIEEFNPAARKIFNLGNHKLIKNSCFKVLKEHTKLISAIRRNEESVIEMHLNGSEGIQYYMVKISPILNNNSQKSGKLIIITDITSISKSEIELRSRNKQLLKEIERNEKLIEDLDSFAHTIAHDLKNMLGGIYSSSEILVDSYKEGNMDMIKEISLMVKESASKTIQITDELLKLATTGNREVPKEPIEMQQIFEQAKGQVTNLISEHEATIEVATTLETVQAYGPWIIEVWMNYISNAIKYGGTPPKITVGSKKLDNDQVKFWIRDNGDGILPENQKLLFNKHTRLSPGKSFGYGLGLSIVKRIIEKMGGTVGVKSSGKKGEGAEFFFILPTR
jgi:PAS domain S-box-containing protein